MPVSSERDAELDLESAAGRLQANDAVGAVQILQTLTRRNPANARIWRMLGIANQQLKQYGQALSAYRKSLELEPQAPVTLYRIGSIQALQKDKEQAFEWLHKAKATRKLDMTQITVDPDLVSLKSDPRFRELLPSPKDFENPFEEPVTILREWDGEAANDQFGWIARNIGDVDADGVPDVVTSAPTKDIGGENAGRVYVYSTRTGKIIWQADGKPGERLGTGVEGAGDTNGDGVPDVIASAPEAGKAMIYSGRDGRVLVTVTAENKGDEFGRHVSTAGDVDHDGYADIIVGAPGNSATGERAGSAYVFSGRDGRLLLRLTGEQAGDEFGSAVGGYSDKNGTILIVGAPKAGPRKTGRTYVYKQLSSKPAFVIESDETGRALGEMFLSVVGDVDGDGMADVYASDWSNAAKGRSTGRVYIRSGADGHSLFTATGETAGEGFGIGVARAGDVDGDGHADLIIGSWQYAGQAVSGGRAYLYSGRDGRLMRTYTCRIPGDTFGFDAVGMGDVDGDGTIDFLITSAWSGIHGYHSGRMFIISSGLKTRPK
ncbi:MAG: FG-GAP-like repeat-containing protein [Bryobacteraceae bacterium]